MALKIYTAPITEPVTLEEAKAHLRVDITDDDALIQSLITTARTDVETITRHALITQTWDLFLDAFPGSILELPFPPLQSVTAVYYTPDGGVETTVTSTWYLVDIYNIPGRILLKRGYSWPGDQLVEANGVKVRFVCGFGDNGSDVDYRARQAVLLLAGHYYENREAVFAGRTSPVLLPQGVHALCEELRAKAYRF